ncbi:MAG: winged helix-turn-helix domain-containing protein [Gammaproteobacteria bacterium]|nr:winged helix-turn-helix domain-containing protein [Gammaproteobacteria bacterium]
MSFKFDDFILDTTNFELRHGGKPQPLEPQVFNLLTYLVEHRDRTVSKQELLDTLWKGRIVSESTLSSCVKAARKAIGDNGQSQKYISTVNRRGFRFIAQVQNENAVASESNTSVVDDIMTQSTLVGSEEQGMACLFPVRSPQPEERIMIAVLPLSSSGTEIVLYFAETLFEDINIRLARTPGFLVMSRNTTAFYKRDDTNDVEAALELGANYIVDGSVRGIGESINLSIKLIETKTGRVLWGVRKTILLEELDALQEQITMNIISAIEPEINRIELATLRKRRPVDLGAWELYRQGSAVLGQKGWSEESFSECADLLRQAIKKDPELAFAHAYLSLILAIGHLVGLVNHDGWHDEALSAAETAIALDSQDPDVLGYAGCAFSDMGDHFRGIKMLERAVELDPSNAQAWAALGAAQLQIGEEKGINNMYHGIRISPRDNRIGAWGALLARALLNFGRVDEAIEVASNACAFDDKIFLPRIVLGVALAQADKPEAAQLAIEDAKRIRPHLSMEDIQRFVRPEEIQQLTKCGLLV